MNYPPYPHNPNDVQGRQHTQWPQTGQPQYIPQPLPPTQYASPPQQWLPPTQYAGPQQGVPSTHNAPPPPAVPMRDPTIQNPYASQNPYSTSLQAPPPPRSRRHIWRRVLIVLGSVSGIIITLFGTIGLCVCLNVIVDSPSYDSNDINIGLIIYGACICIGALTLCRSATFMTGRCIAVFAAVIAAILFLYSIFTSSTPGNFIGGTIILLLAGLLIWTTRKRRW